MKKQLTVLASALALAALTGCSDAVAKLSDSNTVLMTIGSSNITKGQVYTIMSSASGASTCISDATKVVVDNEVAVTDDMKAQASSTLDYYAMLYGDSFTSFLTESGMSEEDYMNEYLIPSLQAQELPKKYINENFDTLVQTYQPVKATVLAFSSEQDALSALSMLNDGSKDAVAVATAYNSTSDGSSTVYTKDSGLDSSVWSVVSTSTIDDGWTEMAGTTTGTYYCVKVDETDVASMKDDIVTTLSSLSTVSSEANAYYFQKYNFHVYDKPLYDALATNYADYLVQAPKASTSGN